MKTCLIQAEIDSIVLAKRRLAPVDWVDRQDIIENQKVITDKIKNLREQGKQFDL